MPFAERLAEITYRDEHFNVRGQFQDFQTIDDELAAEDRPYSRAPRLLASGDWNQGLGAIDYGFDAEMVNFDRNTGVTGWRLDVAPRAGLDWSAPGFFVRPSAGYRYTQYSLEDQAPGSRRLRPRARCRSRRSMRAWCSSAAPARRASAASRSSRARCTCTRRSATRASCRCSTPGCRT